MALGAIVKQKFKDTCLEHPVCLFLRALNGSEHKYAAYEQELYSVLRGVEHFVMFLLI